MNNPELPSIVQRSDHNLSRDNISENALKVMYQLKKAGFQSFLVGGGVRDLLLGREPKDFDVSTNASPEQIRALFRNCRLIGRRFRLAHIYFGREIVEVATFRGQVPAESSSNQVHNEQGRLLVDNIFGTIEEDVWRRDFTINALYYNIDDFSVADYVGGLEDLKSGQLRIIGDPEKRYREDPVRMLRAIRFAATMGFRIEKQTEQKLFELGHLLKDIPPSRLYDESIKLFFNGCALSTFELLRHYGLFEYLYPLTEQSLEVEEEHFPITLVKRAFENTDTRIAEGKPVTPAFLYAALLWEPVRIKTDQLSKSESISHNEAQQMAASLVVAKQSRSTSIPRRFSLPMREIWALQPRLFQRVGKRPLRLLTHPRFRAAYDFLLLRSESGEVAADVCDWWTKIQTVDVAEQKKMAKVQGKRRRHRRPKNSTADRPGK